MPYNLRILEDISQFLEYTHFIDIDIGNFRQDIIINKRKVCLYSSDIKKKYILDKNRLSFYFSRSSTRYLRICRSYYRDFYSNTKIPSS